jgi:hypothetical protein
MIKKIFETSPKKDGSAGWRLANSASLIEGLPLYKMDIKNFVGATSTTAIG